MLVAKGEQLAQCRVSPLQPPARRRAGPSPPTVGPAQVAGQAQVEVEEDQPVHKLQLLRVQLDHRPHPLSLRPLHSTRAPRTRPRVTPSARPQHAAPKRCGAGGPCISSRGFSKTSSPEPQPGVVATSASSVTLILELSSPAYTQQAPRSAQAWRRLWPAKTGPAGGLRLT